MQSLPLGHPIQILRAGTRHKAGDRGRAKRKLNVRARGQVRARILRLVKVRAREMVRVRGSVCGGLQI